MPTKADFQAAAEKFDSAAQQVGDLRVAADGAGAADILRGGSLSRQVPQRIASAAGSVGAARGLIQAAAATCWERVGIIAAYEQQLHSYDQSYYYRQASARFSANYRRWYEDETGKIPHPGNHPRPPARPTPPPAWADVRRP